MKTAMQELKEDLFDTLTTSKEALEEIEDKEKAKDIYKYLEATLKLIIQEIENDYMLKEKDKMKEVWNASYKEMHNSFSNDYYRQKTFEQYFEETFKN